MCSGAALTAAHFELFCVLLSFRSCSIDFEPKWNRNWDEINPEDLYAASNARIAIQCPYTFAAATVPPLCPPRPTPRRALSIICPTQARTPPPTHTLTRSQTSQYLSLSFSLSLAARGAHVICLWLDCDREGENICFEVLRVCEPVMAPHPRGPKAQRIFRAKFSSLVQCNAAVTLALSQ